MEKLEQLVKVYDEYNRKTNAYQMLLAIASFDEETVAPIKGVDERTNAMAYVEGELYEYANNPEILKQLKALYEIDTDEYRKNVLAEILRESKAMENVPQDYIVRLSTAVGEATTAWKQAKTANNYDLFKEYLFKLLDLKKEYIKYRGVKTTPYDVLLDDNEPEMTTEKYDQFFNTLKQRLVPFIQKLQTVPQIDDQKLFENYDIEKQKKVMEVLKKLVDFDSDLITLSESAHPFSNTIALSDGRITVKYLENSLTSAIYSFVHEFGHALYGVQVNPKYRGTAIINSMSMGMHESQSRLMENHIGRSKFFIKKLYKELVKIFPEQLDGISAEEFYRMVNTARCSLIRIEADELTYALHVLVRYELEKAIFNENLPYEEIKNFWNQKYKEYLGLDVPSDAEGILQDVHFSGGMFGYFPTYALGSAFAAQFYETLEKEVNVEYAIENGQFHVIANWLRENIHQYSSTIPSLTLLEKVTGKAFDPNIYVDYLINKFKEVYNLD